VQGPDVIELGTDLVLRPAQPHDAEALGAYFLALSDISRSYFQPHALDSETAQQVCAAADPRVLRYLLCQGAEVLGYFVLDSRIPDHEAQRYAIQGITICSAQDYLFAPSIADAYQGRGYASRAMPALIALARARQARSLVLLGGTQEHNSAAIRLYEKFGFRHHGGYVWHGVMNHDMRLDLQG
jgi:diamine N-acetyltransferase